MPVTGVVETTELAFLAALSDSVEPAKKQIALLCYDELTLEQAVSRLSRVLKGELGLPPSLLRHALQGPNPGPLLRWFSGTARVEVTPIREPAAVLRERIAVELVKTREQLELLFDLAVEADAIEGRAPMAKVRPRVDTERRGRG